MAVASGSIGLVGLKDEPQSRKCIIFCGYARYGVLSALVLTSNKSPSPSLFLYGHWRGIHRKQLQSAKHPAMVLYHRSLKKAIMASLYFPLPNIRPGSLIIFRTKSPRGQPYFNRVSYFFGDIFPIGSLIMSGLLICYCRPPEAVNNRAM